MGNRIGKTTARERRRIKTREIKQSDRVRSGSRESVNTAVTINSQRCLLISEDMIREEESDVMVDGKTSPDAVTSVSSSDEDATVIVNLSDGNSDMENGERSATVMEAAGPLTNLVMPERILNKLTTEDWNELVHIFCNSLEQSLKSTIPQNPEAPYDDIMTNKDIDDSEHIHSPQDKTKRSATVSYSISSKRHSHHHHHHRHKKRPLSLPPDNFLSQHDHRQRKRKNVVVDSIGNTDCPHKSGYHRNSSFENCYGGDASPPVDTTHIHCRRKNCSCKRYITLGQLKDLGLALKTKDPISSIKEGSLECGVSNGFEHALSRPATSMRRSVTSPHDLEQLCYLGPSVDDEQDSSASNMAVADYDVCSTPVIPAPTSYLKVKHLHQHKHRHIHVVHHTTTPFRRGGYLLETAPSTEQ